MVNFINKAVWMLMNPVSIGIGLMLISLCLNKWKKTSRTLAIIAVVWFYFWSTRFATWMVGALLESDFLVNGRMQAAEEYPQADAILDFGGGVGAHTNLSNYAELSQSADRPYFAAKLWQAGKAPIIIPSSENVILADARVLKDFGVEEKAIVVENEALNTEENARRCRELLGEGKKILLVTSAWHMKRSLLMMEKYAPGLKVVPAPCDFEATGETVRFRTSWFKPEPQILANNSVYLHEWLGYWGYRLFR